MIRKRETGDDLQWERDFKKKQRDWLDSSRGSNLDEIKEILLNSVNM